MADQESTTTPPPPPPTEIEIELDGKVQKFSPDRLSALVGLATRDEAGRAEVQRMKQDLEARQAELADAARVGQTLRAFHAANPVAGSALDRAYQALNAGRITPDQLLSALGGNYEHEGVGSSEPAHSAGGDPQMRAMLSQLASQVESLAKSQANLGQSLSDRSTEVAIDEALGKNDFLKGKPRVRDEVKARIQARVKSEGLSIREALAAEEQKWRDLLSDTASTERDRLQGNANARATPIAAGAPPISTADFAPKGITRDTPFKERRKMTKTAFRDAILEGFNRMGGGPVQ